LKPQDHKFRTVVARERRGGVWGTVALSLSLYADAGGLYRYSILMSGMVRYSRVVV